MEKLRLAMDNMVFSLQRAGGATVYWTELLKGFDRDDDIDLTVIERQDAQSNLLRSTYDLHSERTDSTFKNLRLDELAALHVEDADLVHSSYFRYAVGSHAKNVSTIHDFISAKYYKGFVRAFSLWQMQRAIGHSKGIICISESTKADMHAFIPASRDILTRVIHHGVNHSDYYVPEDSRGSTPDDQVCFIGARNRDYKNFDLAVRSVGANPSVRLVIIGSDLTEKERALLDAVIPHRYEVVVFPSSEGIRQIFNDSLALLYLSEYEGFGMPVLEAMASGTPVIAMNRSSIPEVSGGAALLLDESSEKKVADSIELLRTDNEAFLEYRARGIENAQRFTWEKCIQETKEFYFDVLSKG